jgi:hypothetical protein
MVDDATLESDCPLAWDNRAFEQLPLAVRVIVMPNDLLRLPRPVTAEVHRFILTHPTWIGHWLALRQQVALLPSHCEQLKRIIDQINRLESVHEGSDDLN